MRQNYYCPNCGTPVVGGARFCMGCGVNFQWIEQSELEQCSPVSYKLPSSDQQDVSTGHQSLLDQSPQSSHQPALNSGSPVEKNSKHFEGQESLLRTEVSKLLGSFFDKHAGLNKV
jgi:hypothetical protein